MFSTNWYYFYSSKDISWKNNKMNQSSKKEKCNFIYNNKDISWKNKWKSVEMDQFAREEKRNIKRRNHKTNRRLTKDSIRNNDFESIYDWIDLDENSK